MCALSVKAYGFASSPKGRAKSTAGNFLIEPNALATSLRFLAPPSGELARERLRGFVLIFVFLHKMFCGQGFPLDKRANVSYYI